MFFVAKKKNSNILEIAICLAGPILIFNCWIGLAHVVGAS